MRIFYFQPTFPLLSRGLKPTRLCCWPNIPLPLSGTRRANIRFGTMKMLHDPLYRAELEKRLAALRPDSSRKWGKMSVDQMLWHVNTTLQLHLGEITAATARTRLPRRVIKFLVLNLPWPRGAPTLATLVAKQQYDFADEHKRCLQLIDKFTSKKLDEEWPENPIFGKVSGTDLSRLQAKHLDHHLRQSGV